jgi:hypothetical protein
MHERFFSHDNAENGGPTEGNSNINMPSNIETDVRAGAKGESDNLVAAHGDKETNAGIIEKS